MKRIFYIDGQDRFGVHFYSQPESGKKIQLVFSRNAEKYSKMFSEKHFDIISVQGSGKKYNHYKNCNLIESAWTDKIGGKDFYVLFECDRIIQGLDKKEVIQKLRKEKLNNLNLTI